MKTLKKQVVVIHGGDYRRSPAKFLAELKKERVEADDFKSRDKRWRDNLQEALGKDYEVFNPRMPLGDNAAYSEWKVWFEKMTPFLRDGVILMGHSLGGIFLVKYLSENRFPKKIGALMLVAAPYDPARKGKSTLDGFQFKQDLSLISKQATDTRIYHSHDDPVVPYRDALRFKKLLPEASLHSFDKYGHFITQRFPEIAADIRKLKHI